MCGGGRLVQIEISPKPVILFILIKGWLASVATQNRTSRTTIIIKKKRTQKNSPDGHVFHTNSFTLPMPVSGSNTITLRVPETSKNVSATCGIAGMSSFLAAGPCSAAFEAIAARPGMETGIEGASIAVSDWVRAAARICVWIWSASWMLGAIVDASPVDSVRGGVNGGCGGELGAVSDELDINSPWNTNYETKSRGSKMEKKKKKKRSDTRR